MAKAKAKPGSLARFYRSLSVMFNAGIPLHRTLDHLTKHGEDPYLAEVADKLSRNLMAGQSFSGSLKGFPKLFDGFARQMIKIGESSGKLHAVLSSLADHQEWKLKRSKQLQSALVYPAFSLLLCFTLAVLGPPYLLRGHLEVLRTSGIELPLITRCLILLSDAVRSPFFLLVFAGLMVAALAGFRRWVRSHSGKRMFYTILDTLPILSNILRLNGTSRFARSFCALLEAGVNMRIALPMAFASTGHPMLSEQAPACVQRLTNGGTVLESLKDVPHFDPIFCSALEAGEESGKLPEAMKWVAGLYEQDLEELYNRLGSVLEPLLMLATGFCVGAILIGTLSPTIQLLESF